MNTHHLFFTYKLKSMKVILLLSLLSLFILPVKAIHFYPGTYEEALQKAKAENKNLFIDFTTSWCGPCRLMHHIVFNDKKVSQYTDEHYICLLLDIEYAPNTLLQQRISPQRAGSVPCICILTPDEEILKEASALTVGQMMRFLKIKKHHRPIRKILPVEKVKPIVEKEHLFQNRTLYSDVIAQAQKENKNMLLCFSSHFCGPCRQMEETTFQNPSIMEKVKREFVTGYFETGDMQDRALCYRYGNTQMAIPFLILASPEEKIIRKSIGYMDSTAFMDFIRPVTASDQLQGIGTPIHFSEETPNWISRFLYNQSLHKWKLRMTVAMHTTTLKTAGSLSDIDFNYRAGYEVGFSMAYDSRHFSVAPGLSFISKGGKNKNITLRQNYFELPVKLSWIYQNSYNGWWKAIHVSPYGAIKVGEKLKTGNEDLSRDMFNTKRFDYGLRFSTSLRFNSFDFEAGYQLGLYNISKYQQGKMYNRGFFLNVSLCL